MLFAKLVICIIEQGYEYENEANLHTHMNRSLFKYKYIFLLENCSRGEQKERKE